MITKVKLSIIIPVYNTEKYLRQCLDSCLNQDVPYTEYEIIAVNDGSTDSSLSILYEYADHYSNFNIINQNNKKVGGARNAGLNIAKGDYIWFIDSDDYIDQNCLKCIFISFSSAADIIAFHGYNRIVKDELEKMIVPDVTFEDICNRYISSLTVMYLYKRVFLLKNKLLFVENIFYEDYEFVPRSLHKASSFFNIDLITYNYRFNNESITAKNSLFHVLSLYECACCMIQYMKDNLESNDRWCDFFYRYLDRVLSRIFEKVYSLSEIDQKEIFFILYHNSDIKDVLLNGGRKRSLFKICLGYLSVRLYNMLVLINNCYVRVRS